MSADKRPEHHKRDLLLSDRISQGTVKDTFLNLLGHINGGRSVALYGVKLSFRTDMIRGIIKQITFRGFDFLDRPIITANIIRSGELTVLISNIGIYKLIAFVNTVGCTCKRSITLCGTGFFIALSYSRNSFSYCRYSSSEHTHDS